MIVDAHVAVWIILDHPRLGESARELLLGRTDTIYFSLAQLWEVEIKIAAGRMPEISDFSSEIAALGLELVRIEPTDAIRAARLPRHHGDPLDRMLIAQALARDLTIVAHSRAFEPYAGPIVWA